MLPATGIYVQHIFNAILYCSNRHSIWSLFNRETGALCAMKEVEIFPDDPKSAECIKQLEQVIFQHSYILNEINLLNASE